MKLKLKSRKHSLKLVALVTGAILWFYVLNAARIRVDKIVTLQYVLPDHAVFAVKPPSEATVTIEGPRAFMRSVLDREEKIVINLSKKPWRDSLRPQPVLRGSDLVLPFGVKVEKMNPRVLNLRLERKARKTLPVKMSFSGELPPDLVLKDISIKPKEVEVIGPKSLVGAMKEVSVRPVDFESLYGQNSLPLEWNLLDDRILVKGSVEPVLSYSLKAKKANLVLEQVPVRFIGDGKPRQQFVTLVLWAPSDMARRVDKSDLNVQVWADMPANLKRSTEVSLRAVLPPRLHLVEIRPKRILVDPR